MLDLDALSHLDAMLADPTAPVPQAAAPRTAPQPRPTDGAARCPHLRAREAGSA